MKVGKSIEIPRELIWVSWKSVKSNAGSAGVNADQEARLFAADPK